MADHDQEDQESPKESKSDDLLGNVDLEKLLEERVKIDALLQEKFSKNITVMFTDLKGSTSLTGEIGDLEARMLIKKHNDIVIPCIEKTGKLVKTMGDGTMSYFEKSIDGVKAAVEIQIALDDFNRNLLSGNPLLVRIGLHTGVGIVEKDDIYGDVVNVGSRFESLAEAGQIMISEATYQEVKEESDVMVLFNKTSKIKGKPDPVNVYRVFWSEGEYEEAKSRPVTYEASGGMVSESDGGAPGAAGGEFLGDDFASDSTVMFDAATGPRLIIGKKGEGEKTFLLTKSEMILGRGQQADIQLKEKYISREHLKITQEDDQFYIESTSSTTGLKSGDRTLDSKTKMSPNDEFTLGEYTILYKHEAMKSDAPTSEFDEAEGDATVVAGQADGFDDDKDATVVTAPKASITLEVTGPDKQSQMVELTGSSFEIGRSQKCDLPLDDSGISRKHAKISFEQGQPVIEDLGSQNGTLLNGSPIQSSPLKPGDQIKIGKFFLVFNPNQDSDNLAQTQAVDKSVLKKFKSFWKK